MNGGQTACLKHPELREQRYPGRFCIYCGQEIARVENREGQLALVWTSDNRVARYVAVVYDDRQYVIRSLDEVGDGSLRLVLEGRAGYFRVRPQVLLQAFQDSSEVLRDLEPSPG